MKTPDWILMDPAGNRTILVTTPVPVPAQPAVAEELMETEPTAEQVGFLTETGDREIALRMAGGEFCGNATLSAGVYLAMEKGISAGTLTVRTSGAPGPIPVSVERITPTRYRAAAAMPGALSVEQRMLSGKNLPVVTLPGIVHVILEDEIPDRRRAEEQVKHWCRELRAEALGLMFLDRERNTLTPLVYVPGADTLFWESACGSGTVAVGACLYAREQQPFSLTLTQPGGTLTVRAEADGTLYLEGEVEAGDFLNEE